MTRRKPPAPPLDTPTIERLALRYVERFATTRAKLADYLRRKLRERGWEGADAPPVDALVERFAALGYVDDRAFGEMRAAAMARRGLGARRVRQALDHAGVTRDDADAIAQGLADRTVESAVVFARRKRIGPFSPAAPDRAAAARQLGQMLRAGHPADLSRRIVRMPREEMPDGDDPDALMQLILSLS